MQHRGVTEGILPLGPRRRGANHFSTLFLGVLGDHQIMIQNSTIDQIRTFKAALIERLNHPAFHMGYCKPSGHPHIAVGKNFFVGVPVFEKVVYGLMPQTVTLSIFGIKMPFEDAYNLWTQAKTHMLPPFLVDFDFAFECPCPAGIPLFHSRYFHKKGNNSGTTRMFDHLGRGMVHQYHADFGTVRYQIPETSSFITFYPKVVHLMKGETDFTASYLPTTGGGLRNRIESIKLTAGRMKAELEADAAQWSSARVEVTIRGAPSFERAWTQAQAIFGAQSPTIDCKVVLIEDIVTMLDGVILTPPHAGNDHDALLEADKYSVARLQNQIGLYFFYWAKYLPDYSGFNFAGLEHNVHDGFAVPVPPELPLVADQDFIIETYIYEVAGRAGSMQPVRYTYMAQNDNNSRVSKKKLYSSPRDAIDALMENAARRGIPWTDYARPKKSAQQVCLLLPGGAAGAAAVAPARAPGEFDRGAFFAAACDAGAKAAAAKAAAHPPPVASPAPAAGAGASAPAPVLGPRGVDESSSRVLRSHRQ
jgi:hypothetical protein